MVIMRAALILAALIAFAPTGASGHEWYSDLKSPETGIPCCNRLDCRPVPSRYNAYESRLEIQVEGEWLPLDERLIVPRAAPDGDWHACWSKYYDTIRLRCIIGPAGA